jgi:hypothetical protein
MLAFSNYAQEDRGKILPLGELIEKGQFFFRRNRFCIQDINKSKVSTVFGGNLSALSYATEKQEGFKQNEVKLG